MWHVLQDKTLTCICHHLLESLLLIGFEPELGMVGELLNVINHAKFEMNQYIIVTFVRV